MKKYEYLLFDADNTLFDFDMAEFLAFQTVVEKEDLPYPDQLYREYSAINNNLWKKLEAGKITLEALKIERFRTLLLMIGYPDSKKTLAKAAELRDIYMDSLAEQSCLIEGAVEVCQKLSEQYQMYIITNGIGKIQRSRLEKSELKPYFKDIFISEEIGAVKPSSDYFDAVFEKIGCPEREKCLVIGDSLTSDCDGAIAYGLDICRYNPKEQPDNGREITYTVKKLSELIAIL